jgi:hypothetical protein
MDRLIKLGRAHERLAQSLPAGQLLAQGLRI